MTDIHGNPEPHYIHSPVYPYRPPQAHSLPHLEPGLTCLVLVYALFAILYVLGFVSFLPRTGWHDTLVAAASCPSLIAGACWESVKKIPHVGLFLYLLPGLAVATAPFALDFYLMSRH